MKALFVKLALGAALLAPASPALAGAFTDELTQCLVRSTSLDDQQQLVIWVFSAMAKSPTVKQFANISEVQLLNNTKHAASLCSA